MTLHYTTNWYFILSVITYIAICSISEAISHILRSQYKKVEESATECDVLMHHALSAPYWDSTVNLTFKHVLKL